MSTPACGFMYEQGDPPLLERCPNEAVTMALTSFGSYVAACAGCASGHQTQARPDPQGEPS